MCTLPPGDHIRKQGEVTDLADPYQVIAELTRIIDRQGDRLYAVEERLRDLEEERA